MVGKRKKSIFKRFQDWVSGLLDIRDFYDWFRPAIQVGGPVMLSIAWGWWDGLTFFQQLGVFITLLLFSVAFIGVAWNLARTKIPALARYDTSHPAAEVTIGKSGVPLEAVNNGEFLKETVSLDGRHFIDCKFQDCTLKYEGGTVRFSTSCEFVRKNGEPTNFLESETYEVKLTMLLIIAIGLAHPKLKLVINDEFK